MSSGKEIILDAFREIKAHSTLRPASPESILVGFRRLNGLVDRLYTENIEAGLKPLEEPDSELDETWDVRNALVDILALELAPNYGERKVTERLRVNAVLGEETLKNYRSLTINNKKPTSTLPTGQGNQKGQDRASFFGPDSEELNN